MMMMTTIKSYSLGDDIKIVNPIEVNRWGLPNNEKNAASLDKSYIEGCVPNMDGYSLNGANKLKLINPDGDALEIGNYKIEVSNAPKISHEAIEKYKQLVETEKKYGVHGIVIDNTESHEDWRQKTGSLLEANTDKFVYSAYAKAEGISDQKSNIIFDRREFAEKIYLFFNKTENTTFKGLNSKEAYYAEYKKEYYTEDDKEAIKLLTAQVTQAFNELAENIANGKGDSIRALESKITVKGYDVTLGELLDIGDGFKAATQISSKGYGSFSGFTNGDVEYATVGLSKAYFTAYVNEKMDGAAAELAKSTYNEYLDVMIKDHEKWLSTLGVQKGTEEIHPNAAFKGTYKEQMFNIFANIDTSSEKAFRNGINTALQKAVKLDYDIMIKRGAGHDFANRCAQTTKMFINEAINRIISFDKVSTIK